MQKPGDISLLIRASMQPLVDSCIANVSVFNAFASCCRVVLRGLLPGCPFWSWPLPAPHISKHVYYCCKVALSAWLLTSRCTLPFLCVPYMIDVDCVNPDNTSTACTSAELDLLTIAAQQQVMQLA